MRPPKKRHPRRASVQKKRKRKPMVTEQTEENLLSDHTEPAVMNDKKDNDKETKNAKVDKGEKRWFQLGDDPSQKVELTKSEAQAAGKYWAD